MRVLFAKIVKSGGIVLVSVLVDINYQKTNCLVKVRA